jgi:hypothetical protein
MCKTGRLKTVEVVPGFVRVRCAELEAIAEGLSAKEGK